MNILIIDDSDYKVDQITELVREVMPEAHLTVARAFQTGLKKALSGRPDLILLDISLPTFEVTSGEPGGRTRPFGGREILENLSEAQFSPKVIVVTQFDRFGEGRNCVLRDDLMNELRTEFAGMFIEGIYYSGGHSGWKETLRRLLDKLPK